MRLLLFLILFVIILIFAPSLFLDIFLIGGALIKEVATDPMWKYFFYAIGACLCLGFLGFIKDYNSPEAKKQRKYHAEQLEKIKGHDKKEEYIRKEILGEEQQN